jgi:hypothetical protein
VANARAANAASTVMVMSIYGHHRGEVTRETRLGQYAKLER